MHFQKNDLEGNHYLWTEEERNIFIGQPSRRVFNKLNGNQVLFLINFFGELSDRFTLQEGKVIEQKIQYDLPDYAKSEISVFNWIRNSG